MKTENSNPIQSNIPDIRQTVNDPDTCRDLLRTALEHEGVTVDRLQTWFNSFCDGMEYVHKKFGPRREVITFCDSVTIEGVKHTDLVGYSPDLGKTAITRDFLTRILPGIGDDSVVSRSPHTDGELYTPTEIGTLLGVEEAHHHFLWDQHGEKYKGKRYLPAGTNGLTEEDIYNNEIEQDTSRVVRMAIEDFGFQPRIDKSRITYQDEEIVMWKE